MKKGEKLVKKRHKLVKNNYITERKLANLNNQLVKLLQKGSTYVKMLDMVYDPNTNIALKFINLQHNLIVSYMKLVIKFVGVDWLEHLLEGGNRRICLDTCT